MPFSTKTDPQRMRIHLGKIKKLSAGRIGEMHLEMNMSDSSSWPSLSDFAKLQAVPISRFEHRDD